jgi:hypothetical protein
VVVVCLVVVAVDVAIDGVGLGVGLVVGPSVVVFCVVVVPGLPQPCKLIETPTKQTPAARIFARREVMAASSAKTK